MSQANITDIRALRDQIKGRIGAATPKAAPTMEDDVIARLRSADFADEVARCVPANLKFDVARLLRVVESQYKVDGKLKAADPRSVLGAVLECAELGLMPGYMGHIYITTRMRESEESGFGYEAAVVPGYRGLIALAMRSGTIANISARIVYEKEIEADDLFSLYYEGERDYLTHKPILFGERGEAAAVYCLVRFKDGTFTVEAMRADEIAVIKERALAKTFGEDSAWYTDEMEMWKKTAIRRAIKYMDIQVDGISRALQLDDTLFRGDSQALGLRWGTPAPAPAAAASNDGEVSNEDPNGSAAATPPVEQDADRPDAGTPAG